MVLTCAIAVCKNTKKKSRNVVFHNFPKDPSIRKIWIKRCHRTEEFKPMRASICSDHFRPEDYTRDLQSELLNVPTKKKLMPRAVPSLYLTPADMLCKKKERYKEGTSTENIFTGCAVLGCRNVEISCILPGIKLFRFPENQSVSTHWVNACKRKNFNINDAFICSVHFKKTDFAATKLMNKKLKPNAIPTLKLPGKLKSSTVLPSDEKVATKHVEEITIEESPNQKNENISKLKRPLLSREERAAKRANSKFVEEILKEYDKKMELERRYSMNSVSQNTNKSDPKNTSNSDPKIPNSSDPKIPNSSDPKCTNSSDPKCTNNLEQKSVKNSKQMSVNKSKSMENCEQNLPIKTNNPLPPSEINWKQQFENAQQEIEVLKKDNLALLTKDTLYWKNLITCLKNENRYLQQDLNSKINKERQNCESMWKLRLEKVKKSETLLKRQVIALKKTNQILKKSSDNLLFAKDENEPDKSYTEVEFNTRDSKPTKFVYWSVNDVPTAISTLNEIEKTFYHDNL